MLTEIYFVIELFILLLLSYVWFFKVYPNENGDEISIQIILFCIYIYLSPYIVANFNLNFE